MDRKKVYLIGHAHHGLNALTTRLLSHVEMTNVDIVTLTPVEAKEMGVPSQLKPERITYNITPNSFATAKSATTPLNRRQRREAERKAKKLKS